MDILFLSSLIEVFEQYFTLKQSVFLIKLAEVIKITPLWSVIWERLLYLSLREKMKDIQWKTSAREKKITKGEQIAGFKKSLEK